MNPPTDAHIVASATFALVPAVGGVVAVRLDIAQPQPDESGDWACTHVIAGLAGEDEPHSAYGIDSLQALYLSLAMAQARLETLARKYGVSLQGWDGATIGLKIGLR